METAFLVNQNTKKKTIYDADLNFDRTKRIYKTLNNLSNDSVQFLKSGELKEFSFSADRMRPLMAYINDNKVLISKHLDDSDEENNFNGSEIKSFASKTRILRQCFLFLLPEPGFSTHPLQNPPFRHS